MNHPKKINTTLAVTTAVLLEACSSTSAETAGTPAAVVNVKAPELIGSWETGCIATSLSGSSSAKGTSGSSGTGNSLTL